MNEGTLGEAVVGERLVDVEVLAALVAAVLIGRHEGGVYRPVQRSQHRDRSLDELMASSGLTSTTTFGQIGIEMATEADGNAVCLWTE